MNTVTLIQSSAVKLVFFCFQQPAGVFHEVQPFNGLAFCPLHSASLPMAPNTRLQHPSSLDSQFGEWMDDVAKGVLLGGWMGLLLRFSRQLMQSVLLGKYCMFNS